MRQIIFILVAIFIAVGCEEAPTPLPLSEEELIPVLIDIHVAEAALQNLRGETKDSMANVYYDQICTIHRVDRALLDSTLNMLRNRPEQMQEIYVKAMEEIDRRTVENKAESEKE